MYKLNCIVLGNVPCRVFEIKIAPTASVSALQNVIKGAKKPQFGHVTADSLELWKVNLLVDNALKHTLESLELNKMDLLSPVDEMLEHKYLHIVIQGPPAVSSGLLHLQLNCIVLGDVPRHVFEIKIAPTASVSALQQAIKDAKKPRFDHVAADSLKLWKVDLPVDDVLKRTLESLELNEMESISPVDEVLEVFDNAPQHKHLHIVIQCPPAGELPVDITLTQQMS
ncbi:hypothetical protein DFJ58DRAFT_846251 [Suillus subalutaceus]|uniref:uncharacterized protein n=1 Tax=Suillus subalutaceus TaxID=48586 RepID=UPI001B88206C|nr:uncharacterized protein DFJ58DRAFT_846251 [Suillus subalutaceus]KAG1837969.1 hypothetical protein DFJ58DRAFT_846251 [Suillus subalutaceus]